MFLAWIPDLHTHQPIQYTHLDVFIGISTSLKYVNRLSPDLPPATLSTCIHSTCTLPHFSSGERSSTSSFQVLRLNSCGHLFLTHVGSPFKIHPESRIPFPTSTDIILV